MPKQKKVDRWYRKLQKARGKVEAERNKDKDYPKAKPRVIKLVGRRRHEHESVGS